MIHRRVGEVCARKPRGGPGPRARCRVETRPSSALSAQPARAPAFKHTREMWAVFRCSWSSGRGGGKATLDKEASRLLRGEACVLPPG